MKGSRERQRPTLPPFRAVPSALVGLTSLFGMERGGPHRHGHLNFNSDIHTESNILNDIIKGQFKKKK